MNNKCPNCSQYKLGMREGKIFFGILGVLLMFTGIVTQAAGGAGAAVIIIGLIIFGLAFTIRGQICRNCRCIAR